jgi:hypothetical protein
MKKMRGKMRKWRTSPAGKADEGSAWKDGKMEEMSRRKEE